ncbi:hypothetical protein GGS23DRAFT_598632 [Durotheca rogersii]|uniref:uncharacterized protein n=1 Tax=Durotheca rogersii TaxID=419775 RepID=UPI00221E59A7|nr:uncharacterized protein GGS23DRAFT_598632 [Durotheca rogersii]KAI5861481.1 hypothetical protein GGS23DRAFT_598632 [Durotheca rogersii]
MGLRNPFAFGPGPWDPTHRFVTSWLVSPRVLFGLRALMCLYAFVTLLFDIGYLCAHEELGGCQKARDSFSFFTVLTYWGIAFYQLAAALHTLSYLAAPPARGPPLGRWPRPLQALHAFFYTTVVTLPFLVTVVYWAVIYPFGRAWFPSVYAAWSNVSEHALNSAFALVEIALPRTRPPPWLHALWLVVLMALYLALAYLIRAVRGFYPYAFLDPDPAHDGAAGPLVPAYIVGIAAVTVLVFVLVRYLIALRRWLVEDRLGCRGKFAGPSPVPVHDELEMGRVSGLESLVHK